MATTRATRRATPKAARSAGRPPRGSGPRRVGGGRPGRGRQRLVWLIGAVLAVLAFVGVLAGRSGERDATGSSARIATGTGGAAVVRPFALTTLANSTFRVPTGKPTVLFFLAGWCGSCVPEAQALDRIERSAGPKVAILAVSVDPSETPGTLREFMSIVGAPRYPFAIDRDGRLVTMLRIRSLDTTVVLDPSGRVVYRDAVPTDEATLRAALAKAGLS
jgi:thiol-disulfide isomerase/thioredoxin